jgi:hypothetical protein
MIIRRKKRQGALRRGSETRQSFDPGSGHRPAARCVDRRRMLCKGSALRTGLVDMHVPWTLYRPDNPCTFVSSPQLGEGQLEKSNGIEKDGRGAL